MESRNRRPEASGTGDAEEAGAEKASPENDGAQKESGQEEGPTVVIQRG
jgi:hypothetical protein